MLISRRHFVGAGIAIALTARRGSAQTRVVEADISVSDSRVTIPALINAQGPFTLILDTGAQISGLNQRAIDTLRLRPQRQIRLGGEAFPVYAVSELLLGNAVRQRGAAFFGLGEGGQLNGDGLIAAGAITAVDTELLFEAQRWVLHPGGLEDTSRFSAVDARLEPARLAGLSARPFGKVRLGDAELDMVWDTGARHAISIPAAAASRLGLLDPARPYAPVPSSGIHGMARQPARQFAAPPIRLGEHVFGGLHGIIRMADDTEGELILGFPVLRCLDLAIARRGAFIGVRRNGLKPVNPPYGLAGIWIDRMAGGVRVRDVGVGSPAAEAGLQSGDVITNLGDFPSALAALRGEPGTELTLQVLRDGTTRSVRLRLRPYL